MLEASRSAGLGLKVHAEQLGPGGGAALAAEMGATSADHLEHVTPADAYALADAGTVGVLMPGAYVQVSLPLAAGDQLVIPSNALMFRSEGLRVASVDGAGKVKLLPIRVGRNFGPSIEVLDGISGSERLVLNPSDSLAEGDVVVMSSDSP